LQFVTGKRNLSVLPPSSDAQQRTLRITTPLTYLVRQPGCYIAQGWLRDEANGVDMFTWKWWFQLRAENEALEEAYQVGGRVMSEILLKIITCIGILKIIVTL